MSTVNSSTAANTASNVVSATSKSQNIMGKDDFLKLLITQMAHQDPLNPQDETQQIAQLAQFSALEQMKNMNTSTRTTQAVEMLNTTVKWSGDDGNQHEGNVSGVIMKNGEPELKVDELYATVDITKVVGETLKGIVQVKDSEGKMQPGEFKGTITAVTGTDQNPLFEVSVPTYNNMTGEYSEKKYTIDPNDPKKITNVTITTTAALDKVASIIK